MAGMDAPASGPTGGGAAEREPPEFYPTVFTPPHWTVVIWWLALAPWGTALLWTGVGIFIRVKSGKWAGFNCALYYQEEHGEPLFEVGYAFWHVLMITSVPVAAIALALYPGVLVHRLRRRDPAAGPTVLCLCGLAFLLVVLLLDPFGVVRWIKD